MFTKTNSPSVASASVQTHRSQFDPPIIRLRRLIGQYGSPRDWALPYHRNSFCPAQFGEINVMVSARYSVSLGGLCCISNDAAPFPEQVEIPQ